MRILIILLYMLGSFTLFSQNLPVIEGTLTWEAPKRINVNSDEEKSPEWITVLGFENCQFEDSFKGLPAFFRKVPLSQYGTLTARLQERQIIPATAWTPVEDQKKVLQENFQIVTEVVMERNQSFGLIYLLPMRSIGGTIELLKDFAIQLSFQPKALPSTIQGRGVTTSVLNSGTFYKIPIAEDGIYKIDAAYLSALGVNTSNVDPRRLTLFTGTIGMLPDLNSAERIDDLVEVPVEVVGESDGRFDGSDYLLFYGSSSSPIQYDAQRNSLTRPLNIYDQNHYYFLRIDGDNGLRVSNKPSVAASNVVDTYDYLYRYEKDEYNLLYDEPSEHGTGKQWFGDYFRTTRERPYDVSIPNTVSGQPATLEVVFAGRSSSNTSYNVSVNGNTFSSSITSTSLTSVTSNYANISVIREQIVLNNDNFPITLSYPGSAEGWLDYIQLNARASLRFGTSPLQFRDLQSLGQTSSLFQVQNAASNMKVWDISSPSAVARMDGSLSGNVFSFGASTSTLNTYIAFTDSQAKVPSTGSLVANQNLHSIQDPHMVIIYPKVFSADAERLAAHRRAYSQFEVALVDVDQIYNEFSSGRKDPVAIRDFNRMLHERSTRFNYVLLFGDGSFDARDIKKQGNDFIPAYETDNSVNPVEGYPYDDFFALLSPTEGEGIIGMMDVALGRLTVANESEAKAVVDKIIRYETDPVTLGDWRNRVVYVGDDEDGGLHTRDSDKVATSAQGFNDNLNLDKVYLDAFTQVSTAGGVRIPAATEALRNNIFQGVLAVTYLGHGGPKGWAQERVLKNSDINGYTNTNQLPLFITATCSFSSFDDPSIVSSGEYLLNSNRGGAIALLSTVRPVYANENYRLTKAVSDTMFNKFNNVNLPIGEIFRIIKNAQPASNARKFFLLGDPALKLALPDHHVRITNLKGTDIPIGYACDSASCLRLSALEEVELSGLIEDDFGNFLPNFNGTVSVTVFDKEVTYNTLGQDSGSPVIPFTLQKNVLFRGKATVVNGLFTISFVVPKDINVLVQGKGKISFYASDSQTMEDASGSFKEFFVQGINANGATDNLPPLVDVYMNDDRFVFGGITNEAPVLFVQLKDDKGINVVGNSIGHDLTAVLDDNTQQTFLLNNFYEANVDDFRKGEVKYPLADLAEGLHTIKVRAWDIANNAAEGYTEFVVAGSEAVALDHVLNYPNPFTTSTCFEFEHNLNGQEIDVMVQIFTITGKLVKTIDQKIFSQGSRLSQGDCIRWEGNDDFGDRLAKGVYVYKVKVRSVNTQQTGESGFEKIVLLR